MQRNKIAPWPMGERPGASLSDQQLAILDMTRRGKSAAAIAHVLGCSASSVDQQRRRIQRKLGVPARVGIVARGGAIFLLSNP